MRPGKSKSFGPKGRLAAFSLVEVAIAVGIFAFAIIATISLLAVSLDSNRNAAADTRLALMTETVSALVKNQGFGVVATNSNYSATPTPLYFDNNGQPALTSTAGAIQFKPLQADSLYSCAIVSRAAPATFNSTAGASTNLLYLTMTFRWPVSAPVANQNIRTVNMTLANE